MTKESFHVHMNLDVVNNSSTEPKRLVFNMTRTIPFLTNAEDYFLTVARFNLQTSNSLPVFIPDIQTGQQDRNLTVYTITMTAYNGAANSTQALSVMYECSDISQPLPSPPLTTVDKSSTYYWMYNVSDWVRLLNITLNNLTLRLNTQLGTSIIPPYIQYDLTTGLFTMFVSQTAFQNNSFNIYFNASLYNILPFPSVYLPFVNSPVAPQGYQVLIQNSIANQSTAQVNGVNQNFLSTTTEFSPLSLLCPIRSIYFSTNLLPIEPLLTQPPKVYNDSNLAGANAGVPGITNI